VLVVSAVLAGCGGVASPPSDATVTVVTTADSGELDPAERFRPQQELLLRNVFQTLLTEGPDGGEPLNDLAESCRFSTPTAYTCRLKEAGFPDGTRVSPADVAWTLVGRRVGNAPVPPEVTRLQGLIRSVQTVDDYTFTLELAHPDPALPYLLTLPEAAIVRSGSGLSAAVGSGPYQVESVSGDDVVLVANPHYSSAAVVANDRVVIRQVADADAGTAAVADGSADVFYPGDVRQSAALVTVAEGSEITRSASASITVLTLDKVLPAESEQPVRQALAALLDRSALARTADETIVSLNSVLPSDRQWSTGPALEDDSPNPGRAAELLSGAGVQTPVPLPIVRPPGLTDALWDEFLRQLSAGGLFEPERTEAIGAAALVLTQSPATPDPVDYLSLATEADRSPVLADLIDRARKDTDLASREQSVIDAQDHIADRSLVVPLWQVTNTAVSRAGVDGVTVSPFLRLWPLRPPG